MSEPPHSPPPARTGVILVLTTVHPPDDPRVRTRTVGVLARRYRVRYATKGPGPTDRHDHEWVALGGGRIRRNLAALREAWRGDVMLVSIHDPELAPLGLAVAALRGLPVVFDVHEDLPAQIRTKEWLPRWSRPIVAPLARLLLRIAERRMTITLADPHQAPLFARRHPVLENYPLVDVWPDFVADGTDVVYVGDVTEVRGALFAVEAVGAMTAPRRLRLIGRCSTDLRERILDLARRRGVEVDLPGYLPHPEAMRAIASASVGLCPLADVPSYRGALPTKMLEYLSVGVPVIASDLPGTASVLAGRTGVSLLPAGDVGAWSARLDEAVADRSLRDRTRAAATEVRSAFRWPAERLLEIYAAAMAGGSSAGARGDEGEPRP